MVQLQNVPRILLSGSNQNTKLPGSDQKSGTDTLSGLDQKLGTNFKSWTEDMGNLCNIQAGGARVGTFV